MKEEEDLYDFRFVAVVYDCTHLENWIELMDLDVFVWNWEGRELSRDGGVERWRASPHANLILCDQPAIFSQGLKMLQLNYSHRGYSRETIKVRAKSGSRAHLWRFAASFPAFH